MATGRPKLPKGEAKDHMLVCRVRAEEEAVVREAAAADGKALSEWMRDILVAAARRRTAQAKPKKRATRKRKKP